MSACDWRDARLDEITLPGPASDWLTLRQLLQTGQERTIYLWFCHMLFCYGLDWLPGQELSERQVSRMLDLLQTLNLTFDPL